MKSCLLAKGSIFKSMQRQDNDGINSLTMASNGTGVDKKILIKLQNSNVRSMKKVSQI